MQATIFQPDLEKKSKPGSAGFRQLKGEQGIAMILVMVALSLLTAFSAFLFLGSVEEVRISDNSESMLQARFAARAGIDHAREVIRGLTFNDLLRGPDGAFNSESSYLATARSFGFRNLTTWAAFRSLDIANPASVIGTLPDDGLFNTGRVGTTNGTVLAPTTGIAFNSGSAIMARYFLKVTDNNGEARELVGDTADNPFIDGDGTIIVRSIGVARAIAEGSGSGMRRNSVAIFEARFERGSPFSDMGSPAIVIGSEIDATFSGNAFDIVGNSAGPGIGTIDTDLGDIYHPDEILTAATNGKGIISGNCPPPNKQCIGDITSSVISDPAKSNLRDPNWLYNFVFNEIPTMADNVIASGRIGTENLGTTLNPKITYVTGDLDATGGITGAGLLVVTGSLDMGGQIVWDGLVLVVGEGDFWAHGMNRGIYGGLVIANLIHDDTAGTTTFGKSTIFDISGNSNIATYDGSLANMGNGLIPVRQLSFREIRNGIDP